jgi:hypothetical protein
MIVLQRAHRQVWGLGLEVVSFRAPASLCVISIGRSDVQASQARKLMGLWSVQMAHVHPVNGWGAGIGVGVADTGGLEEDEAPLGSGEVRDEVILGFFVTDSVTRRLTCRASGRVPREDATGRVLDEEEELSGLNGS